MPHAHDAVDVTRHVLRMADAGHQLRVLPAAFQRLFRLVIVPVVDAIVMRAGMVRLQRQDLAQDQLGSITGVAHIGQRQQRPSLDVVRILDADCFENFFVAPRALFVVLVASFVARGVGQHLRFQGLDVETLALAHSVFALRRFPDEFLRALAVIGRASQPPVRHGVIRFQLDAPAESALGLVKPERMKQGVTLVEPLLHFRVLCRDREMSFPDARHGPGLLAGPRIKRLTVERVPLLIGCRRRLGGRSRRLSGGEQSHR